MAEDDTIEREVGSSPAPGGRGGGEGPGRGRLLAIVLGIGIPALVLFAVILSDNPDEGGGEPAAAPAPTSSTPAPTTAPEPTTTSEPSANERVESALSDVDGPVEDPEIERVSFGSGVVTVTAKTPEGGFEGASTQDLDWQAGAIFADVYGEADYTGSAIVQFEGGLVDSATGEDLPHAKTGKYFMAAQRAKRIDWDDDDGVEEQIDWSLYRTFASPALKQS